MAIGWGAVGLGQYFNKKAGLSPAFENPQRQGACRGVISYSRP